MNQESIFFDWLTYAWLMDNLGIIVAIMLGSVAILFLFPILLGYSIKDEIEHAEKNDSLKEENNS